MEWRGLLRRSLIRAQQPVVPSEPKVLHPVEKWAHDIADEEFPDQVNQIFIMHGRHDMTYCLRDREGHWLAEVGYDHSGRFRITREVKT